MDGGGLLVIHRHLLPSPSQLTSKSSQSRFCFPQRERKRVKLFSLGPGSNRFNLNSSSFAASAASSSPSPSFGGSGAEYSERLLGPQTKEKKKKIAGIDQDELVDPTSLADPDSYFCEFNGVKIHHKVYEAESSTKQTISNFKFPMILLHGFGASLFSWQRVMKPLAQVAGTKVLAFDRPAFGLTSRVNLHDKRSKDTKSLNPYSMIFSVLVTMYFINFLAAEKVALVGHSAGALVAVNTYFKAPERVAALVLVAPAFVAPLMAPHRTIDGNQSGTDGEKQGDSSNSDVYKNPFLRLCNILSKFLKFIMQPIKRLLKGMGQMASSLYKKSLSAVLRSALVVMLIRFVIDKFGIAAVRNSWYDPNQVTEHVLNGYTKPLRAKGWDKALAEYTAAMLTDDSLSETKPSLAKRLKDILCPVLIITGDCDRLVPSWNSERVARAIPGSSLEVIKNCGHLPHEEKPEEFVSVIGKFLQRVSS